MSIGCSEALTKKLSSLTLTLGWQGAPTSFGDHYQGYEVSGMGNGYFTAGVAFSDAGTWNQASTVTLFENRNESGERVLRFNPNTPSGSTPVATGLQIYGLSIAGSAWAHALALKSVRANPVFTSFLSPSPERRGGFITVALNRSFLHDVYRRKQMENVVKYASGTNLVVLNEPYVPSIQHISLSYSAVSDEVSIASASQGDFTNPDVQFFHVGCFGQMREHGYQRAQFSFVEDPRVHLLPPYETGGQLCIGISGLAGGDSVSLLFQCAQGSADPDLEPPPVAWSVLCDNYWRGLTTADMLTDTTRNLRASGVVAVVVPADATTSNTILPPGRVWLRAHLTNAVAGVCQLIEVKTNAIEVEYIPNSAGADRTALTVPAGTISRLRTPIDGVKSVTQPFASFGGRLAESDEVLRTRAAERLRHKARAVTAWDYERIVLQAFPEVHKVKCIPHARDGAWFAPGNVLVVVVPDLRNKNAVDPLQPRVDAATIARIAEVLRNRAGLGVAFEVRNPKYQQVTLDFKVRFYPGFEFNFHRRQLEQGILAYLSPWTFDGQRPISFGGAIYKSVLLDFIEELPYVDYLTDFKMYTHTGAAPSFTDVNVASAERPDAILVSAAAHSIGPVP